MSVLDKLDFERPTKNEIDSRIEKLRVRMVEKDIDFAILFQNTDIFYFTGTMQNSVFFISKNGDILFFVEKSIERAKRETYFDIIPVSDNNGIFKIIKQNE